MNYQGGKARLARRIAEVVTQAPGNLYVEPFLGGGSTFAAIAPAYPLAIATEALEDIALLWQAAVKGWVPPTELTIDEYQALRGEEPSALRGFAGTTCSWGGKWFEGYARGKSENYAAEGSRSVVRKATALAAANVHIYHADYRALTPIMQEGVVAYADPPYLGTTGYKGVGAFDSDAFWRVMDTWYEKGAEVFVSEYNAPAPWGPVWERERTVSLSNRGLRATEKLFKRG